MTAFNSTQWPLNLNKLNGEKKMHAIDWDKDDQCSLLNNLSKQFLQVVCVYCWSWAEPHLEYFAVSCAKFANNYNLKVDKLKSKDFNLGAQNNC